MRAISALDGFLFVTSTYVIGGLAFLFGAIIAVASLGGFPVQAGQVLQHLAAASIALAY